MQMNKFLSLLTHVMTIITKKIKPNLHIENKKQKHIKTPADNKYR
jgi:hypothetical protein